jgi:ribosome-binding protein aMBF1 (putative translation factor)
MVCPRCGGSLTAYELSGAETVSCEDCAYIGVSVDHTSTDGQRESWDEAIDRFYEQHRDETMDDEDVEVLSDDADVLDESEKVKPTYAADDADAREENGDAAAPDPSD